MPSSQSSTRIVQAVFTLTMAESIDASTMVAIDPLEVASVSGEPLDKVNTVLEWLVAAGIADGI